MARTYPRFLFSNPQNTKSKGPFLNHTIFPRMLCRLHYREAPEIYPLDRDQVFLRFQNKKFGIELIDLWDDATEDQVNFVLSQMDKWLSGIINASPHLLPLASWIRLKQGETKRILTGNYNTISFGIINIQCEMAVNNCHVVFNNHSLIYTQGESLNNKAFLLNGLRGQSAVFPVIQNNSISFTAEIAESEILDIIPELTIFYELLNANEPDLNFGT